MKFALTTLIISMISFSFSLSKGTYTQSPIQIARDEADKKEKDKTEYINPYVSYDSYREYKAEYDFFVGVIFIFLVAAGLSLPNLVLACLKRNCEKNKANTIILSFFLNIIIHINLGGIIIGSSTNTEGKSFFLIASVVLFCIIIFIVIVYLIYSFCYNVRYRLFKSLENLYPRDMNLKTLQESISFYKQFPPVINIEGIGKIEESQEIWNKYEQWVEKSFEKNFDGFYEWNYYPRAKKTHMYISDWGRTKDGGGKMPNDTLHSRSECECLVNTRIRENYNKTIEFEYGSWEDDTKIDNSIFYGDSNMAQVEYTMKIEFDPEAEKDIEEIKNKLKDEMKDICDTREVNEKFSCPKLGGYQKLCYINENAKNRSSFGNIFIFVVWFLSFCSGYSSIADYFFIKEEKNVSIEFIKKVSGKNEKIYRANYNENDVPKEYGHPNVPNNIGYNNINYNNINNNINNNFYDKKEMLITLKDNNEY